MFPVEYIYEVNWIKTSYKIFISFCFGRLQSVFYYPTFFFFFIFSIFFEPILFLTAHAISIRNLSYHPPGNTFEINISVKKQFPMYAFKADTAIRFCYFSPPLPLKSDCGMFRNISGDIRIPLFIAYRLYFFPYMDFP